MTAYDGDDPTCTPHVYSAERDELVRRHRQRGRPHHPRRERRRGEDGRRPVHPEGRHSTDRRESGSRQLPVLRLTRLEGGIAALQPSGPVGLESRSGRRPADRGPAAVMLLEGGVQAHCEGGSRPARRKCPSCQCPDPASTGTTGGERAGGRQLGLHLAARAITQWAQFGMAVALAPGTLPETSRPVEILMNYWRRLGLKEVSKRSPNRGVLFG